VCCSDAWISLNWSGSEQYVVNCGRFQSQFSAQPPLKHHLTAQTCRLCFFSSLIRWSVRVRTVRGELWQIPMPSARPLLTDHFAQLKPAICFLSVDLTRLGQCVENCGRFQSQPSAQPLNWPNQAESVAGLAVLQNLSYSSGYNLSISKSRITILMS